MTKEYGDMQENELNGIVPDSTQMLKQLLAQQAKDKHRVFGRDIFSSKELSFEPNMNIATPRNYRRGLAMQLSLIFTEHLSAPFRAHFSPMAK